ncbi:MAG: hypothetical protein ACRDNS_01805, partial [Trebonia sp.]
IDIPDVEIHECPRGDNALVHAAAIAGADLVIASDQVARPVDIWRLMDSRHGARVLTVSHDGRSGEVYEMRPQRSHVGELSADTLRAAAEPDTRRAV